MDANRHGHINTSNYFMYIRVWALCGPCAMPLRIKLLHLDQACVEDFISNLADGHFPSFKHGHMSPYHLRIEYEPFQRILCLEVSPLVSFQSSLGQE